MKIISMLGKLFEPDAAVLLDRLDDCAAWRRDPLAHPAVSAMSLRELADLPLRAGARPSGREPSAAGRRVLRVR